MKDIVLAEARTPFTRILINRQKDDLLRFNGTAFVLPNDMRVVINFKSSDTKQEIVDTILATQRRAESMYQEWLDNEVKDEEIFY